MEQLLDLISDFQYQLKEEIDMLDPEVSEEETLLHKLQDMDDMANIIHCELIDLIYNKWKNLQTFKKSTTALAC